MSQPGVEDLLLHYEVAKFLNHEAELLDRREFEAWLDLLAEDLRYWMPLARNRPFGDWHNEYSRRGQDLNWFDEGKFEIEQRVKQIMTGRHWAEEPISRTTHLLSNIQVTASNAAEVTAGCRFLVYRNRTETETDFFVGKREDLLRRNDDAWQIAERRIYLDQNTLLAKNLTVFF